MIAKVNYGLSKPTFKHIEAEIYKYKNTVEEIKKLRYNIIQSTPDENVGGGRSGIISNPTEMLATRLDTHKQLEYLEDIVYAIETVYNISPLHFRKLIKLRYWEHPDLNWDDLALEMHCSKKTAQRWRDKIVYNIAEHLGWR
ncbi:transcriptional regulator [Neobacillus mesonae]|uniref:transcriptional regulator n=1 Tax=Neobacillus mesonae TaxID=1193713 RepID=UPI002E20E844|nr:transcriptional regulator [Neobacillus mesonae]